MGYTCFCVASCSLMAWSITYPSRTSAWPCMTALSLVDRLEAHDRRHDDGKEPQHERRDHLGDQPEAEPHHEQRRDRDLGHALREHEQRIDVALHGARVGDHER